MLRMAEPLREFDDPDSSHITIAYEFIPRGKNDENAVQEACSLLHRAGFYYSSAPPVTEGAACS